MRPATTPFGEQGVVAEYQDPNQRVEIHKDTVDEQFSLRDQYKNQVFKPGHNMPTRSLDDLADEEYADAMGRQAKEQE